MCSNSSIESAIATIPNSVGALLKSAFGSHNQLSTLLHTESYRLRIVGDRLCAARNDPMFSLYVASLLQELEDAMNMQLEKQSRLIQVFSFPDRMIVPAPTSLKQKVRRGLCHDLKNARRLMRMLAEIGVVCDCPQHAQQRSLALRCTIGNASQ